MIFSNERDGIIYHYSPQTMVDITGGTFADFVRDRVIEKDAGEIIENTFLDFRDRSIYNSSRAVVQASLNPVSPGHALAFPSPEMIGASKDKRGRWHNLPEDGGFINVSKEAVWATFSELFNWTVRGYFNAPFYDEDALPTQSFWTANIGRAATLAVPLLHVHLLTLHQDDFYKKFKLIDPNTERFIRKSELSPVEIFRQAFKDKHGEDTLSKLFDRAPLISLTDTVSSLNLPDGISVISPDEARKVKKNDFAVELTVPSSDFEFELPLIKLKMREMISAAYDIQKMLCEKENGAAGFTMVADTTALQNPSQVKPDENGNITLSMHFVTHMKDDPEWMRGGFVYTHTAYTAPSPDTPKAGL